jgi:hypothetical protein
VKRPFSTVKTAFSITLPSPVSNRAPLYAVTLFDALLDSGPAQAATPSAATMTASAAKSFL